MSSSTNTSLLTCSTAPNVIFSSRAELAEHYKSDWHRYNLRRRAAGLQPITKDVFDKVVLAANSKNKPNEPKQDHLKKKDVTTTTTTSNNNNNNNKPTTNQQQQQPPIITERNVDRLIVEASQNFMYDPRCCLWDRNSKLNTNNNNNNNKISPDIETNLDHMHREHGFYIPDMQYVINVEGLLRYCAEKIWVGRICLFCDKSFRSGEATAVHMTTKGHCRIPWETEDDIEEYGDFYDFSKMDSEKLDLEVDPLTEELVLKGEDGEEIRVGHSDMRFRYHHLTSAKPTGFFATQTMSERLRQEREHIPESSTDRSLQLYRRIGVSTSSALSLVPATRKRLASLQRERAQTRQNSSEWQFKVSAAKSLSVKDRKAGTNVGAGHGVHG
jgi:hypothetical protein